jgi:16S rRNA (adenine1518-N6/adenine1519-N6)-dimethyltransferase
MGTPDGDDPRLQGEGGGQGASLGKTLAKHGLKADKGLGQHFLVSPRAIGQVVAAAEGLAGILEVGPGPGVITAPLSQRSKVVALEIDPRMVELLAEVAPSAKVVLGDALDADLGTLLASLPAPRGIVSNMPYNITGPLLERFTEARRWVDRLVLMMQREVGEKILAQPGDSARGALSVRLQALFQIVRVCLVPLGAFLPPPKVESIVLRLEPRDQSLPERFDAIVRTGFSQPRKTLVNNLKVPRERVLTALSSLGLAEKTRPHQLTEDQWIELSLRL